MPSRDRVRKPARRPSFREPLPVILVVCEGEVTEPEYLRAHARACHNPRVEIEISKEHGDPKFLVESAKRLKKSNRKNADRQGDENIAYDAVWCVCDVDDHERLDAAKVMARDNGISLAISNPSFELWLLLHFQESPGMKPREVIRQLLKNHVPTYVKSVDYRRFAGRYTVAVTRATQLESAANAAGEPYRNPSTGVFKLTELIRGSSGMS